MIQRLFGLEIESEIALPELTASDGSGPADVQIRLARDPAARAVTLDGRLDGDCLDCTYTVDGMQFRVRAGRRIDIVAPAETPENEIRLWLTGSVMALLLFQRGLMPIHANVVALPSGGAAAFVGDSGAGKSTLAAALDRAGFTVLGDDLAAIGFDPSGRPQVYEGLARIKLWSDAMARMALSPEGHERVAQDLDKWHVPTSQRGSVGRREPLPLERIYLLDRRDRPDEPVLVPLGGAEAGAVVLANAFRWEMGQHLMEDPRWQFDKTLAIAAHVRVSRFRRLFDPTRDDEELATIVADLNVS